MTSAPEGRTRSDSGRAFVSALEIGALDASSVPAPRLHAALRRWAWGSDTRESAVALLGEFGCPEGYWIRDDTFTRGCLSVETALAAGGKSLEVEARIDGWALECLLDAGAIPGSAGALQVLHAVSSLLGYATRMPMADLIAGLDAETTAMVLRAMARAGGWRESQVSCRVRRSRGPVEADVRDAAERDAS